MSKIGRNDPCPCESGKKYKKCCLLKGIEYSSVPKEQDSFTGLIAGYCKYDLIKTFAALQLLPENHGKNVRFEIIAKEIIAKGTPNNNTIAFSALKDFLQRNFEEHYLEDPVSSFFTENVVFFSGNFTVFPGLAHNGTGLLNLYLESIFTRTNTLPQGYKDLIYRAAIMILALGESISLHAHLERYIYHEIEQSNLSVPTENILKILKEAVTFDKTFIEKLAKFYEVDYSAIDEFVVNESDPNLLHPDVDNSPLLTRPLIKNGDEIIFALPSAQVTALIEFIIERAQAFNSVDSLFSAYYDHMWFKVRELLYDNGWLETDIQLPPKNQNIAAREAIFQFDNDKLCYVCLIENINIKEAAGEQQYQFFSRVEALHKLYEERGNVVLQYLKDLNQTCPYKYLTLLIGGENGRPSYFTFSKPTEENQIIGLGYGDFQKIMQSEETDELSLWKFAKIYNDTSKEMQLSPMSSFLDLYEVYQHNEQSLFPLEAKRPSFLLVPVGEATDFEREIVKRRDEHGALQHTKFGLNHVPVRRLREFAPIYVEKEKSASHSLLLECYSSPVWIRNFQATTKESQQFANHFLEAIAFWLNKMQPDLSKYLSQVKKMPVEFIVELDESLFDVSEIEEIEKSNSSGVSVEVSATNEIIRLKIHESISAMLMRHDNQGEVEIMRNALKGLTDYLDKNGLDILSTEQIEIILQKHLQPPTAKMILFFDSTRDIRLDTRWLIPFRTVQESETSKILNNLVGELNLPNPIPAKITSEREKGQLCNSIVALLVNKLTAKLKSFDAVELLKWILKMYEGCVRQREFREIQIPAKIACFSDFPTEVQKMVDDENKLVHVSLAMRTVIEFIVANPDFGQSAVNLDDIDELVALADSIVDWGFLSDIIVFEMTDIKMGLLASGRIGTGKQFVNEGLQPFSQAKIEGDIFNFQKDFADKFSPTLVKPEEPQSKEVTELNAAFESEFGLTLTELLRIEYALIGMVIKNSDSVIEIECRKVEQLLTEQLTGLESKRLKLGLALITLTKRKSVIKAPKGFEQSDIYPWKFNRALSYLRKPLLKVQKADGTDVYLWGFRHMYSSSKNLESLIFSGKLKVKSGGKMASFLSEVNREKGAVYRKAVAEWLIANTTLKVIPYEVDISENGHLSADKNYGDIDILAIDEQLKIIYAIECKNTVSAKAIHEMKAEMDKYLGKDGKGGMIKMHVNRDLWLKAHMDDLKIFVPNPGEYQIKSFILTYAEIPLPYLIKQDLPLPFLSYQKLIREGQQILLKL